MGRQVAPLASRRREEHLSATTTQVAGRTVPLPCLVRDASAATVTFLADADALRERLPHRRLEVVEPIPGRGVVTISAIHYRDNDLGSYDELSIATVVRLLDDPTPPPRLSSLLGAHRGGVGTCVLRLPVDDEFSCLAGRHIWGFPKTVEDLEVSTRDGPTVAVWRADGRDVLRMAVRPAGRLRLPSAEQLTYTVLDGELVRVSFVLDAAGASLGPGGAKLHLGDGEAADDLRALRLTRPLFSVAIDALGGRFDAPVTLD